MLAVMSSTFYNVNGFIYNDSTGQISKNEDFNGVNILFELPIDDTLGNEEKVSSFFEEHSLKSKDSNILQNDNIITKIYI